VLKSKASYPLKDIPEKEKIFLKPTSQVQSESDIIKT